MSLFDRIVFKGREAGPSLLVTAGVHGDEPEGVQALQELASIPDQVDVIRGAVTLVPVVNPGAVARHSRVGEDGLDLARTMPGNSAGSVSERIAFELAALIREADFYIDLHSGGDALEIEPLVGYMLVSDANVCWQQDRLATAFGLPIVWATSADLDGRTISVARDAGVPAIYAEYGGGGVVSREGVEAYKGGCLRVMSLLNLRPGQDRFEHPLIHISDPRSDSGHLQVQQRSPVTGVFESLHPIGTRVEAGDAVGIVRIADGSECIIRAERTGRLIAIRALPSVSRDDCLAVILERVL